MFSRTRMIMWQHHADKHRSFGAKQVHRMLQLFSQQWGVLVAHLGALHYFDSLQRALIDRLDRDALALAN